MTSSKVLVRNVVVPVTLVVIVLVFILLAIPWERERLYRNEIETHRSQIEKFMRTSPESPILGDRSKFQGLSYFPADRRYIVTASLEHIEDTPLLPIPTTGGTEDLYERYAWATFEFDGENYRLLLLRSLEPQTDNALFLAYHDATNGDDTYFGGRYVNLYLDDPDTITIDFNRSYNPYCVYDPEYLCPIPPPENRLPFRVEAGELMWWPPV